jgi:hypothetical protein
MGNVASSDGLCECCFPSGKRGHNSDKRQPLLHHEMAPTARATPSPSDTSLNDSYASGYSMSQSSGSGYSQEPRDRKAMLQTSMHKPMLHTTYRPSEAYLEDQRQQQAAGGNQPTGHYSPQQQSIPEARKEVHFLPDICLLLCLTMFCCATV